MSETLKEQGFSSTDDRAQIQTQALKTYVHQNYVQKIAMRNPLYLLFSLQKICKTTGRDIPNAFVLAHI